MIGDGEWVGVGQEVFSCQICFSDILCKKGCKHFAMCGTYLASRKNRGARGKSCVLPKLAKHMTILDHLTKKDCDKTFPPWTTKHQHTFDSIKRLAVSTKCLTTIDLTQIPASKIFVTTDASDSGSGAMLSLGPSYNTARPVAYDSRSFKGAELNYPVHEKELLAIPLEQCSGTSQGCRSANNGSGL